MSRWPLRLLVIVAVVSVAVHFLFSNPTILNDHSTVRHREQTSDMRQPSLFISHGGPDIVLANNPSSKFLKSLWKDYLATNPPKEILVISAHLDTDEPTVLVDEHPDTIYDFGGFARELYEIKYKAPGATSLAERVANLLETSQAASSPVIRRKKRGYDHGCWVPLQLIRPEADIPVTQLSVQSGQSAEYHFKLGQALRPLRDEGVLIIGSGSMTHNLGKIFHYMRGGGANPGVDKQTRAFSDWFHNNIKGGHVQHLLDFLKQAPNARDSHPTDDHILPFFVALGAADDIQQAVRIHDHVLAVAMAMDAYLFK